MRTCKFCYWKPVSQPTRPSFSLSGRRNFHYNAGREPNWAIRVFTRRTWQGGSRFPVARYCHVCSRTGRLIKLEAPTAKLHGDGLATCQGFFFFFPFLSLPSPTNLIASKQQLREDGQTNVCPHAIPNWIHLPGTLIKSKRGWINRSGSVWQ